MFTIKNAVGNVHSNQNAKDMQLILTVTLSEDIINKLYKDAIKQVVADYPTVLNPVGFGAQLSRRENEQYLTGCVKVCMGKGDYVTRNVKLELPQIIWN